MSRKMLSILLVVLIAILTGALVWIAVSLIPPEAEKEAEEVLPDDLEVIYTFTGEESALAGFAQGEITITPTVSQTTSGYYLIYFADKNGPLAGYDELASVPITGETVTCTVKDGVLLPYAATRLAVFESESRFLDEPPAKADAAAIIKLPEEKRLRLTDAALSFGAISDVHMNYEPYSRGAYAKWEAALNFFAAEQMEYVFVTGDMTGDESEKPLAEQYATYLNIARQSDFDENKIYECIGNHGNTPIGREQFVQYTAGAEEDHPFEGSAWYSLLLEGEGRDNLFIVMAQELDAPGQSATRDNFSEEQIDWVESLLEQYADTDTNIFVIEHAPFYDYGAGDRDNGQYTSTIQRKPYFPQTMRFQKLLAKYKDVVMLSGHTHLSLYDNENYSDVNGEFCRTVHLGSGCQPCSYGTGDTLERSTDGRYAVTTTYGSEAYTVQVYEDYIVFTGYNLSTMKVIPHACFILPV